MSAPSTALPPFTTWAALAAVVTAVHALALQVPAKNLALDLAPKTQASASQPVRLAGARMLPFDTRQLQATAPATLPATPPVTPPAAQAAVRAAAPMTRVAAAEPATLSVHLPVTLSVTAPASGSESAHDAAEETVAAVPTPRKGGKKPVTDKAGSGPAVSPLLPPSRRLRYDVVGEARKFPYTAHAELLWQHDGSTYNARLEIAAMFLPPRVQTSQGQITSLGLAPQRFSDKFRTEVAAHFDRDKGKVIFSANTPDANLLPGAQDRLSVLLQLAGLLAGEPGRYPTGSSISLQTVGPRDTDEWRFVVGAEENLTLGDGNHPARKLSRAPQRDYDLHVDVWLALDMGGLPVQLRMTQSNGDFVQLQLKSAENL